MWKLVCEQTRVGTRRALVLRRFVWSKKLYLPVGQLRTDASDHLLLIVGRAQVCFECGSVAVTLDEHKVGGFVHTLKTSYPRHPGSASDWGRNTAMCSRCRVRTGW